jgi:hypothetical protein
MRRRTTIAILVAALALVAAGCGGDDETTSASEPEAWAQSFCTAVTTWTNELQSIRDQFTDLSSLNEESLRDAAESAESATQDFVDEVRALGAPDTESGDAIQDSVQVLADTVEDEKATIEEAAEDVSGLAELPGAISTIGNALSAMASAFQSALETIADADAGGELESAFESSDACDDLTS